jgi:hypothetical protein
MCADIHAARRRWRSSSRRALRCTPCASSSWRVRRCDARLRCEALSLFVFVFVFVLLSLFPFPADFAGAAAQAGGRGRLVAGHARVHHSGMHLSPPAPESTLILSSESKTLLFTHRACKRTRQRGPPPPSCSRGRSRAPPPPRARAAARASWRRWRARGSGCSSSACCRRRRTPPREAHLREGHPREGPWCGMRRMTLHAQPLTPPRCRSARRRGVLAQRRARAQVPAAGATP